MNIYKAIRGNFEKSTAGELLTNYFRIKTMVYLQKLIFHLKKKKKSIYRNQPILFNKWFSEVKSKLEKSPKNTKFTN